MSQKDDNQIRYRLKVLSQIEPSPEASNRTLQQVRNSLLTDKAIPKPCLRLPLVIIKFAAAAVLFVGVGFIAGRLFAPPQPDMEELQASLKASLEPAIRQNILAQINEQWQKESVRNYTQIKNEIQQQLNAELAEFAEQTLAASGTITDQRMKELIQLIEAARAKDRQWIAAALEQIEINRRQDNARIGSLVTFAAQTNQSQRIEQN
jgi:hypothetical protein